MKARKHQPVRVNFLGNDSDLQVLVLAKLGQTSKSIGKRLRMSESQVQYRIIKGGGKWCRFMFRNGASEEFTMCHQAVGSRIAASETSALKKAIAKLIDKRGD